MPSCRLYKMSSHETGDVVLRTSRRASFTRDVMYMQTNITDPAAFAMSPDGSQVACYQSDVLYIGDTNSGDMRGLNISHDLATGSVGHHLAIVALQFSFDGRRLFAADCWGSLRIMELDDEGSLTYLPPANNMDNMLAVSSAAFSSNGEYCVFNLCPRQLSWTFSGPEFQVVLRSMQPGAETRVLHDVHTDIFSSNSVFTPNSLHLIHANDRNIFVWDVARQTLHTKIAYDYSDLAWPTRIKSLTAISNTVCASMTEDGIVDLWDPVQGTHLRTLVESNTKVPLNVFGLTCSSDGRLLGMVANTRLQLIDVTYGHVVAQHTLSARLVLYRHDRASIELDHLNSRLSVSRFPGHPIFIWTYDLAHAPRAVAPLTFLGDVTCVSFSTDGSLLVSGAEDGSITVLASDTGFLIAQYPGEGLITAALMSTPNSRFVLSARELLLGESSYDMEEHFVFQVNDSKTADDMGFSKRYSIPCVYAVAISPDKQHLALWFNSLAKMFTATFDIHTGHAAACLPDQPTEDIESPEFIAYTPDGLTIVQTRSHTILLRNARTLVIRHILQGSRDEDPSSLAFTVISPCSTRVGRISRDGLHMRLRVWSIESGSVLMTHHFQEVDHGQHWGLLSPIWTHNHLLYASRDSISTWNFDESTSAHTHVWPRLSRPKSMCASDDLSYIYAWCEDEHVRVWTTHGFHTEKPILEVAASRQWPQDVMRALWRGSLFSAAHYATELRMIVPFEQRYLSVIINLEDGFCVQAIPFGDGQKISPLSQIPVSNRRMYMSSHGSKYCAKLVRRLAQIPFNKDDEAYKWIETVQDIFENLRHALLQVWNIDTGEMEAIITCNGTTTELEHIPPSFALRHSHCEVNLEKGLLQQYSLYDSCLRIYSDSPLKQVCKLGIPSGRRPTMSRHVMETADIAIHGNLVAIGSTHGTVSIFDFSQAIKAAEARARVGSHVPSTSLLG
jgi:WD40 repeat protein